MVALNLIMVGWRCVSRFFLYILLFSVSGCWLNTLWLGCSTVIRFVFWNTFILRFFKPPLPSVMFLEGCSLLLTVEIGFGLVLLYFLFLYSVVW